MVVAFPALALIAPVLEAFGTLSIPLFTQTSLLFTGSLMALGFVLGAVAAVAMPKRPCRPGRELLFVGILVATALIIADVAAGGHRVLTSVAATRIGRLGVLTLAALVLFGAFWGVRRRAVRLLFVASVAFFASTVAVNLSVFSSRPSAEPLPLPSEPPSDKPPFVYIVADGAMGVEGLSLAPMGQELAAEARELFERHGFRVYGRAFSRHFVSGRSIPNTLNFDFADNSWGPILRHHTGLKVRSALFEALAADGYQVVSYGTEHVDFCFPVATRCEILPSFNPFSAYIDPQQLDSFALYQLVWKAFGESYLLYRSAALLFAVFQETAPSPFAGVDAFAFPRWFARFQMDVTSTTRGRAYFAHLLMPHAPYVLDRGCQSTGKSVVAYFLTEDRHLTSTALERARIDGYRHYREQYRCLLGKLDGLLTGIESLPQFSDATIVVHGDHGPRISAGQYVENVSAKDMIDNYSALYAIRRPGVAAGYDRRMASVQRLTAEYFSEHANSFGPDDLTVAIDSQERGKVVLRQMPVFETPSATQWSTH